jgi:hypothetical protein
MLPATAALKLVGCSCGELERTTLRPQSAAQMLILSGSYTPKIKKSGRVVRTFGRKNAGDSNRGNRLCQEV